MKYYYHKNGKPSHIVFDITSLETDRVDLVDAKYPLQISSIKFKKSTNVPAHIHKDHDSPKKIKEVQHEIWVI